MSSTVRVKAAPGRVVREHPTGPLIPEDRYVAAPNTPYMRRLIHVHGDAILDPKEPPVKQKPKPEPTADKAIKAPLAKPTEEKEPK